MQSSCTIKPIKKSCKQARKPEARQFTWLNSEMANGFMLPADDNWLVLASWKSEHKRILKLIQDPPEKGSDRVPTWAWEGTRQQHYYMFAILGLPRGSGGKSDRMHFSIQKHQLYDPLTHTPFPAQVPNHWGTGSQGLTSLGDSAQSQNWCIWLIWHWGRNPHH